MYLAIPKIIKMIQKMEGSKGALSLGAKQLKMLAKEDTKLAKMLSRVDNPSLDIAYKAKSNYNVAAFRLRDGKEAVANGAVSLQNPGTAESIVKYRLNVGENGNILRTNGFGDFGKQLDVDDLSAAVSRRKGITSAEVDSGKALRVAAELNEEGAVKFASHYSGLPVDIIKNVTYGRLSGGANNVQRIWREAGEALSGAPKGPKAGEPISAAELKLKTFDPDVFKKGAAGKDEALTKLKKISAEDMDEFVNASGNTCKKIKQPDLPNIKDYIAKNSLKLKEGEIKALKSDNLRIKKELADMERQFEKLTDEGDKAKLAAKYEEYTGHLKKNEDCLADIMWEFKE